MEGIVNHVFICHGASFVNNELLHENEFNQYDMIQKINVKSTLQIISLCLPFLRMTGGSVTVLSSVAGEQPMKNYNMFNESYASLNMMVKCASLENAKLHNNLSVRFNAVAATPHEMMEEKFTDEYI
jgi:NAD(P)-dependent dehydrogenase (short-subunit alcohol dehydrogenase family)